VNFENQFNKIMLIRQSYVEMETMTWWANYNEMWRYCGRIFQVWCFLFVNHSYRCVYNRQIS